MKTIHSTIIRSALALCLVAGALGCSPRAIQSATHVAPGTVAAPGGGLLAPAAPAAIERASRTHDVTATRPVGMPTRTETAMPLSVAPSRLRAARECWRCNR